MSFPIRGWLSFLHKRSLINIKILSWTDTRRKLQIRFENLCDPTYETTTKYPSWLKVCDSVIHPKLFSVSERGTTNHTLIRYNKIPELDSSVHTLLPQETGVSGLDKRPRCKTTYPNLQNLGIFFFYSIQFLFVCFVLTKDKLLL